MKRLVRTVTTVVVVLALVASVSVAPVAAMPEDDGGLLGGDSGTDGGLLGGDTGIVGDDGVSVGGDEGVNVSTDGVGVAGETVGTDSVGTSGSDLPTDSVTETVGSSTGDGLPVGSSVGDGLPVGSAPNASLPGGSVPGGGAPGVGDLVGPDGVYDTEDSSLYLDRVDVLGPLPNSGENGEVVADQLSASSEDLPVSGDQVPTDSLPTEQAPGPQALPVGSDSQIDCAKPVEADDLPAGALPYIDDLPAQPPSVPLVPTRVTSPENVAGLAFSFAPDQCEIYDPDDPSVDPTDPPTDPSGEFDTNQLRMNDEEAAYAGNSAGELEEGGPGWNALWLVTADGEEVRAVEDFQATDGKTPRYFGVSSDFSGERDLSSSRASLTVYVPGAGGLNTGYECGDVQRSDVDPLDDPTQTCRVVQPVPRVVTPQKVVDVVKDPPEYGLPDIEEGALPVDL